MQGWMQSYWIMVQRAFFTASLLVKFTGSIRQGLMLNQHFFAVILASEMGGMSFAVPTSSRF